MCRQGFGDEFSPKAATTFTPMLLALPLLPNRVLLCCSGSAASLPVCSLPSEMLLLVLPTCPSALGMGHLWDWEFRCQEICWGRHLPGRLMVGRAMGFPSGIGTPCCTHRSLKIHRVASVEPLVSASDWVEMQGQDGLVQSLMSLSWGSRA